MIRLRQSAKYCKFGDREADEIKLQIKMACSSGKLRRKAFSEKDWDLTKLVSFARLLEASEKSAQEIEGGLHAQVNKLNIDTKYSRTKRTDSYRPRENSYGPRENRCQNCGFEYPHAGGMKSCPAAQIQCRYCSKVGHFELQCRSKENPMG